MTQNKPDMAPPDDVDIAEPETAEVTGKQEVSQEVKDESTELQERLEQAQREAAHNWNQYLQLRAELDNVRKRAERELQNAHKYALDKFVAELLPVKDSLEMGLAAANETADIAKLREGTELTLKMLTAAVAKFGVSEIDPKGEKFNPELHEAISMQPSTEVAPNTVLHVIQKGYQLHDRLVRPAMVIVAQAAAKPADKAN